MHRAKLPALAAKMTLPERAISRTTGHRAEQVRVDLDNLLNVLRGNVRASCGTRVHGDNDAVLELERERCCAVLKANLYR